MEIISLLSHGFIQRALIAGSFIAILSATLGTFLVLRRFSLIGDGLAHVTFGGVAVGLFLGFYPMYVAVPIVMISSLGILKLVEKARLYGDAAIGIVSSLGIACGILLASAAGGFNVDLFSYLFGNILAISATEVASSIVLSIVLMFIIWFFYQELLAITFDEESAKASGVKTETINGILVMLTSLTVVLAMRVVGIMLISSLLILPPVMALQVARGFRMTIVIASVGGVTSVILGIVLSLAVDLPTGATIVILNFLFFTGAFVSGKVLGR